MNKILTIAEVAQAHDGSLGLLHSFIDAAAATGVDAMKFQMHIADAESSPYEPFRVKFSYKDKTRYDYWKRMEFTLEEWREIKKHCDAAGLEFMCSPFSNAAVDRLEEVGVKRYKIGSGEVTNFLLLEKVARTGKDIILSSGMSSFQELDDAVAFIRKFGNHFAMLQCTTRYPTAPEDIGLNVIAELRDRYACPVGFSDHSGFVYPCLAAAALGAEILEAHVTFDKRMFGPDAKASLNFSELKQMIEGIRYIEQSLAHKIDKATNEQFLEVKKIFEKSLAVNKTLSAGHIITFADLEAKKPFGRGIPARQYQEVMGRKLKVAKSGNDFLQKEDLM